MSSLSRRRRGRKIARKKSQPPPPPPQPVAVPSGDDSDSSDDEMIESKSPMTTTPKTITKSPAKPEKTKRSKHQQPFAEIDSDCGFYKEDDKRRSYRLRTKKLGSRKRKRSTSPDDKKETPPKKKAKVKRRTTPRNAEMATPTLTDKQKGKRRGKRYYKLIEITSHKLVKDIKEILDEQSVEYQWYNSLNFAPIQKMMRDIVEHEGDEDDDVNSNVNGKEYDEDEKIQFVFGRLQFQCKWEGIDEATWEYWDTLSKTIIFRKYIEDKNWKTEMHATIEEHTEDEIRDIIMNMAVYGNPTVRKALKVLFLPEMRVW